MWYLLATSLAALSLNKSLAYLLLGLTAFLGWKQGVLDAPALLVIASIVIGWSVVEWLRNKNNKYTYLVEGLCVARRAWADFHGESGDGSVSSQNG